MGYMAMREDFIPFIKDNFYGNPCMCFMAEYSNNPCICPDRQKDIESDNK